MPDHYRLVTLLCEDVSDEDAEAIFQPGRLFELLGPGARCDGDPILEIVSVIGSPIIESVSIDG